MAFTAQIQDAASDIVRQSPVETAEEVVARLHGFDWAAERAKDAAIGGDYNPPELSIICDATGDVLHILPEGGGAHTVWLHTDEPRKLLGFIPLKASVLFTSSNTTDAKLRTSISQFLAGDRSWFAANFQKDTLP